MGWKLRSDDGKQAVLDIGDWGSAIFKAAPPEQTTALVDGFGFAIEPWNAKTVEAELRKRDLNPVADNDGKGFESFHVKDPDGFDVQIGNSNGLVKARKTPATAKLEVELPFEATGWQTVWLDHFSFGATNYKASVSFYTNLLGWEGTYDEGSQNEVLMGDVGDALIRGGNPNDPNFGKPPAEREGKRRGRRNVRIDHISFGIQPWDPDAVKDGLEKRGLRAQVDTGNTGDIHQAAYKSFHTADAQRIRSADELRHQGHAADRIDLDEAEAVVRQQSVIRGRPFGEEQLKPSRSTIAEPGSPKTNNVGNARSRIREHARGVDQGTAPCASFDPFLNVLVEPLKADSQSRSAHFVQHEIVQPRPRLAGNVELFAVCVPPVGGKTDIADARFAQWTQLPLHRVGSDECENLQKSATVGRTVKILVGKPHVVVILPEYSRHDGALHRMAEIGSDEFVVVVPTTEVVRGNGIEPILKETSAQCIPGLRLLGDPLRLFYGEIQKPLAKQRSPMDAAIALCLRQGRRPPVGGGVGCSVARRRGR